MKKKFYEEIQDMSFSPKKFIAFCFYIFLLYQFGYAIGKLIAHLT